MSRLTSVQTQSFFQQRSHQPEMESAKIAPISSINSDGTGRRVSLKSLSSNPPLHSPDPGKKSIPHIAARAAPYSRPAGQEFVMHITIDESCVTQLRYLAIRTCGELLTFIRIQPIARTTKMKVWLCLRKPAVNLIMDAIMRSLPTAEFGRITPA